MKEPTLDLQNNFPSEHAQLQTKVKELSTATEKLAQKDAELQQKIKELSNMTESLQKKDKELSELKLGAAEIHKIKSELDQANANLAALGKRVGTFTVPFKNMRTLKFKIQPNVTFFTTVSQRRGLVRRQSLAQQGQKVMFNALIGRFLYFCGQSVVNDMIDGSKTCK